MNEFSNDILLNILLYSDGTDWLHTLHSVCRKWSDLMPLVWRQIEKIEIMTEAQCRLTLTEGRRTIVNLSGELSDDEKNDAATAACSSVSTKRKFPHKYRYPIWFLISKCERLCKLSVNLTDSRLKEVIGVVDANLTNLTEFKFAGNKSENCSNLFRNVFAACKRLRHVDIRFYDLPKIDEIYLLECLPDLEELSLIIWSSVVELEFFHNFLASINRCSNKLNSVRFWCRISESLRANDFHESLTTIGRSEKRIQSLSINIWLHMGDLNYDPDSQIPEHVYQVPWENSENALASLSEFRYLRKLVLGYFDFTNQLALIALQNFAHRLTDLRLLINNFGLGDHFYEDWHTDMPNLKILTLPWKPSTPLYADVLSAFLTEYCPNLHKLVFVVRSLAWPIFERFLLNLHKILHECDSGKKNTTANRLVVEFVCPLFNGEENLFTSITELRLCSLVVSSSALPAKKKILIYKSCI